MRVGRWCAALLLCAVASRAWAYEPAVNFQLQCMGCHQGDGSGQEGRVPSMRRTLALFSLSRGGRNFVIRVPGVAQSPLSDQEVAGLLNWLVYNVSEIPVSNDFIEYTTEEVARLRHRPLTHVRAARACLLRAATSRSGKSQRATACVN